MLADVPPYAIADIGAQLRLAADEEALGWMPGRKAVCGPEFAGSDHVGGADADVIVDGELIDCKATMKPRNLGARELYQLAGYLLLDYWVNAAKAVSTLPGVSVPSTKLVSRTNRGPVSGAAVVERRRPAPKFTLAGGSRLIAGA